MQETNQKLNMAPNSRRQQQSAAATSLYWVALVRERERWEGGGGIVFRCGQQETGWFLAVKRGKDERKSGSKQARERERETDEIKVLLCTKTTDNVMFFPSPTPCQVGPAPPQPSLLLLSISYLISTLHTLQMTQRCVCIMQ